MTQTPDGSLQQVILVRHGETEWSRSHRHTGRTDLALTDEGRHQGRLLGHHLRDHACSLVLPSPARRAI